MNSLERLGKRPTRVTGVVRVDVSKASSLVFDGGIEGTTRGFIVLLSVRLDLLAVFNVLFLRAWFLERLTLNFMLG
jgi:hypothetical protein